MFDNPQMLPFLPELYQLFPGQMRYRTGYVLLLSVFLCDAQDDEWVHYPVRQLQNLTGIAAFTNLWKRLHYLVSKDLIEIKSGYHFKVKVNIDNPRLQRTILRIEANAEE